LKSVGDFSVLRAYFKYNKNYLLDQYIASFVTSSTLDNSANANPLLSTDPVNLSRSLLNCFSISLF